MQFLKLAGDGLEDIFINTDKISAIHLDRAHASVYVDGEALVFEDAGDIAVIRRFVEAHKCFKR